MPNLRSGATDPDGNVVWCSQRVPLGAISAIACMGHTAPRARSAARSPLLKASSVHR